MRAVFADRPLRAITILYTVTNALDHGLIVILDPLWAREAGRSAAFVGLVLSVAGGAAACSALAVAWLGARLPRQGAYLAGVLLSGRTRMIVLALDCPPTVVVAVYAIAGVGSGLFNPPLRAVIAEVAPTGLRGRVYALVDAISWVGLPFAGLLASTGVSAVGLPGTLWAFGMAYLLACCTRSGASPGTPPYRWSTRSPHHDASTNPAPQPRHHTALEHLTCPTSPPIATVRTSRRPPAVRRSPAGAASYVSSRRATSCLAAAIRSSVPATSAAALLGAGEGPDREDLHAANSHPLPCQHPTADNVAPALTTRSRADSHQPTLHSHEKGRRLRR